MQDALVWCRRLIDPWAISRAVGYLFVTLALLFPSVLQAVDHHGAERLAAHPVVALSGGTSPTVPGFALPHVHVDGESVYATAQSTQPSVQGQLGPFAFFSGLDLALPVHPSDGLFPPFAEPPLRRTDDAIAQWQLAPPTPPPTTSLA